MPKTPGQNQDAFWGRNDRWNWQDIVALLFIISAVVPSILTIFGGNQWLIKLPPTSPWALSIPLFTAAVGIVLAIRYRRLGRDPIGWKWLAVPVVLALQWLISSQFHALMRSQEAVVSIDAGEGGHMALALLVITPLLLVPVAEELVFRQWLPHRLPIFRHLIWNASFFALLHISVVNTLPDMALRFAEILVAGGFLFLARMYTNNLLFTIVLHALLNLTMGLLLNISPG